MSHLSDEELLKYVDQLDQRWLKAKTLSKKEKDELWKEIQTINTVETERRLFSLALLFLEKREEITGQKPTEEERIAAIWWLQTYYWHLEDTGLLFALTRIKELEII